MSYERSRDVDTFPASWCPSFSSPSVAQNPSLSMDLKDFRRPYCSTKMFVCVLPSVTKMRVYLRSILFLVKILIKKN